MSRPGDNDHTTIVCDAWQAGVGRSSFNMLDIQVEDLGINFFVFFVVKYIWKEESISRVVNVL